MDTDFENALERCLREIPQGRVATCGVIASALGDLRAARAVATWLVEHPNMAAAHRVVRSDGRPVLAAALPQLEDEGVHAIKGRVPIERVIQRWNSTGLFTALREEQKELANRVVERDDPVRFDRVTGVDLAYDGDHVYAAAATLDRGSLEPLEIATIRSTAKFPYVPTYLAYREFPGIEAAVNRLSRPPQLLLVDGHGRLHPALFGVACFVGIRLNVPTIGVAKHPLAGRVDPTSHSANGATPIRLDGRIRGYAWLPPGRSRPIYVSVGNRVSLERALEIVRTTTRHAYPEALRLADRMSKEMKRNEKREKGARQ